MFTVTRAGSWLLTLIGTYLFIPGLALLPAASQADAAGVLLVGAGSQAREHPLDLRTINLVWQGAVSSSDNGWQTDWELNAGQLQTNEGNTHWGGGGLGVNYRLTPNTRFRLGGRISYLDRFQFIYEDDATVLRLRNYGGHRQFSFSASLIWHLSGRWGPGVGYRFEHMSNAYLYDSNPGIDTHNLMLFIPLGKPQ